MVPSYLICKVRAFLASPELQNVVAHLSPSNPLFYGKLTTMRAALVLLFITATVIGQRTHVPTAASNEKPRRLEFTDITKSAGINWGITKLAPGIKFLIETMGGGGGFIDYNNDGLLDIYLVSYSQTAQPDPNFKPHDVLYRNNGDGTFTDVTASAGINDTMLGMGIAVGDYDNDGNRDIYVTGYGESKLYRNKGNGTFIDVTAQAGVNNKEWGTGAAWFDYDNDGYLDLFVANYVSFDPNGKVPCDFIYGRPYCYLDRFQGSSSKLYHNNQDGTFTDVSEKARIRGHLGKGLGVIAFDYNNDGWMDIFQANDTAANFLFRNDGNGTFSEVALEAGCAFDRNGHARGGMGVDADNLSGTGYQDVFVTNFSAQENAFWHNNGDGTFDEITYALGLGTISIPFSGFGTRFFDYDNDGRDDLFVLNGHPFESIEKMFPKTTYAERPFLFANTGEAFREVAFEHGAALKRSYLGRGLAIGDFDNDGDEDLLLMNAGQPPVLLRNDGGNQNHWLGIKLIGTRSNRDAIGAWVTIKAGPLRRVKQLLGGTSYLSASDLRLLFGLGKNKKVDEVHVRWPSGFESTLRDVPANQSLILKEGP